MELHAGAPFRGIRLKRSRNMERMSPEARRRLRQEARLVKYEQAPARRSGRKIMKEMRERSSSNS